MNTKIYTTIEQDFINEWKSLWEKSPYANYINSPQWFISVLESFKFKKYVIIAIYKNKHLQAVISLVNKKKYGINIYTTPPEDFVCGLPFLINATDNKIIHTLFHEISQLGTTFINNAPEGLSKIIKNTTQPIETNGELNFFMHIEKDKSGQVIIKNKNKIMRKAKEIEHKIHIKSYHGSSSIDALKIAFTIDKNSTKHKKGYNSFIDSQVYYFYRSLARLYKEKIIITILYCNSRPIGYEIGFIVNRTFYGNQIATVAGFEKYSLGRIFLIKLIESLAARGIKKIDFGSGDDHVKRSFTKNYQQLRESIISKNKITRTYLNILLRLKKYIYKHFQQHSNIYSLYRLIKNLSYKFIFLSIAQLPH